MKKIMLFFICFALFSAYHLAYASLIINEVMYDLSGSDSTGTPSKSREWIEIYNPDSSDISIDASKWRIYDGSANRTINGEVNFSILAGSYVIFAGDKDTFLVDHPSFSGVVYDTGITTLNNTGATLKIVNPDLIDPIDLFSYTSIQGGAGDGNTLQKIGGTWSGITPTPGIANETVTPPPPPVLDSGGSGSSSGGSSSSSSSGNTTETKTKIAEIPKIKTQIISKTFGLVGVPLSLQATTYGYQGEQLYSGKYFWNFGDGDSKEMQITYSQPFTHTYFYPGEYVVSLDYYQNYYSNIPEASNQITIKIIQADISISRVGDEKDFFIELTNNTDYSADLSNWVLVSAGKSFIIPKNTILMPKKKTTISSRISNFSILDKDTLKLMTPEREVVFDYSFSVTPTEVPAVQSPEKKILMIKKESPNKNLIQEDLPAQTGVPISANASLGESVEDLQALALNSGVSGQDGKDSGALIPIVAFFFIGASAGGVYFIRRKKVISSAENDFEILDK